MSQEIMEDFEEIKMPLREEILAQKLLEKC